MNHLFGKLNLRDALQRTTTHTFVGDIEVGRKKHLLFSSSAGCHLRGRKVDTTYLEEDGTYIPIYCLKEKMIIHHSRILAGQAIFTPQNMDGRDKRSWETRDIFNRVCFKPIDPVTNRPDIPSVPRARRLEDAISWYLPQGVRILNMPILVGEMDVVFSMPATLAPRLGARRELARLIPGLLTHLKQYKLQLGHVVEIHLEPEGKARRIYLIIDRRTDRDLGDIQAWILGMTIIFKEISRIDLQQLTVLRPPDHYLLTGWKEIAYLLTFLRIKENLPEIILATGTHPTDKRYLNSDPVLISQAHQPGIRLPRLEQPMAPITTIFDRYPFKRLPKFPIVSHLQE